jgi:hypothetical protein
VPYLMGTHPEVKHRLRDRDMDPEVCMDLERKYRRYSTDALICMLEKAKFLVLSRFVCHEVPCPHIGMCILIFLLFSRGP